MKAKQVLCISLIATILVLLMAGCTSKANNTAGTSTAAPASSTASAKTEAAAEKTAEPQKEPLMVVTASLTSNGSKYFTSMADPNNDKYIKKLRNSLISDWMLRSGSIPRIRSLSI